MKVSIIVPIYNIKEFLPACLNSIIDQTYKDFEAILVDDGSTDGSSLIVDEYASRDSRFVSLHKKNGGLVRAWQDGVKKTSGDYLLFIDGDDFFAVDAISNLMKPVEAHNVDMSIGNFFYDHRPNGGQLVQHQNYMEEGLYAGEKLIDIYRNIIPKAGNYLSPSRCGKLIRRSVFMENMHYSNPDISSAEDVNIMLPVLFSCKSVYCSKVNVFYYVNRGTSISHTLRESFLDGYISLIGILEKVIEDKKLPLDKDIHNLYNKYGILWYTYVYDSNLAYKDKIRQMRRLRDIEGFGKYLSYLKMSDGPIYLMYKYAVKFNCPFLYVMYRKLHDIIRK